MSVGLLIICHDGIGPAILGTTSLMMDGCPLKAKVLTASRDSDPDEILDHAKEIIAEFDMEEGVLVLTDLFGSTPCNVARKLIPQNNIRIVSGLNLSMLIRVMNYPDLTLDELAEKAISGGQEGIKLIGTE